MLDITATICLVTKREIIQILFLKQKDATISMKSQTFFPHQTLQTDK